MARKCSTRVLGRPGQAPKRRDHHREEGKQERHQHLGGGPVSDPDHHQRRECNLGQPLEQHEQGIERAVGDRPGKDRDRHKNTADDRGRVTKDDLFAGDERLVDEICTADPQGLEDGRERRQQVGLDLKNLDRLLPQ